MPVQSQTVRLTTRNTFCSTHRAPIAKSAVRATTAKEFLLKDLNPLHAAGLLKRNEIAKPSVVEPLSEKPTAAIAELKQVDVLKRVGSARAAVRPRGGGVAARAIFEAGASAAERVRGAYGEAWTIPRRCALIWARWRNSWWCWIRRRSARWSSVNLKV